MPAYKDRRGRWNYRKRIKLPDGRRTRIFGVSPANTKVDAERAERAHLARLLSGLIVEEKKEVPRFKQFAAQFLALAETKNKPSSMDTSEMVLRVHLKLAFGNALP